MRHTMMIINIYFAFFCLSISSVKADHDPNIVCATSEHAEACKRIEATRNDIKCLKVSDSTECLQQILKKNAHFGTFTPEEAILASYYINDQVRAVAQVRHPDRTDEKFAFETVVVVHKNFAGGFSGLQNVTYCHPGFIQGRYWSDLVLKHFERTLLKHFEHDIDPDEKQRTADEDQLHKLSRVFKAACRPGSWSVSDWWDRKLKKEYGSLCAKCDSPSECSYKSEFRNEHFAALTCLIQHDDGLVYTALGHVTKFFDLKHQEKNRYADPEDYRFLCSDGSTRPLSDPNVCSWIRQPWPVVLSLSSVSSSVKSLLKESVTDVAFTGWKTALKKIVVHENGVLNFAPEDMKLTDYIQEGRVIPEYDHKGRSLNWCTISQKEKSKCEFMAKASLAFGVPVQIECSQADTKIDCLKRIHQKKSDVTFIDTQLGFIARKVYNLTSAAFVETEKTGNYYGVVATKGKRIERFRDLKGKSACLPLYNGLGWLSHVQTVRRLNLVPNMLCSDSRGLWNFFSKACAPGAKSAELNKFSDLTPNKLCQSCIANGSGVQCDASPENPYYSEVGALRCLNNGDGDVAVLDFHAIKRLFESGSKNTEGIKLEDFKILCRDETIKDFNLEDPEECSITQFNGGEIVMKENLPLYEKRDITLTLIEIDNLFGHNMKQYPPTYKMYESFEGEMGLLFKDKSVALISAFDRQNNYVNNYLKLQEEMSTCYRDNSGGRVYLSLIVILSALIFIFIEQ